MPWIQNVALSDIEKGLHFDPQNNTILIQIVDHDMEFPTPKYKFIETHQYKFLDVDEDQYEHAIKQDQADSIAGVLIHAKEKGYNVIVHCVAGICRSGAVCEVGVIMGFEDTHYHRTPNFLVKKKIMNALGLTYEEEPPKYIWNDLFGVYVCNPNHPNNQL